MTNEEAIRILENAAWLGTKEQEEKVSEAVRMAIDALKAQLTEKDTTSDCISRQAAIDEAEEWIEAVYCDHDEQRERDAIKHVINGIKKLPPVQPESLSDAYIKAVWTWLLDYQIKAAELKGRYTPYEVLSWVANDWRKEHEGFD